MNVLLHMCCAPCSIYPVEVLLSEKIYVHGFFFNPNIHPKDEFSKRKENVEIFSEIKDIPVTYSGEFLQDVWEAFPGSPEERCNMCYSIRLNETAKHAYENGFDAFSTTLLVSPYQKHDTIKQLGEKYSQKYGISFFYKDFRSGFRQGQQSAKSMGLYRQKFCGCIVSKNK